MTDVMMAKESERERCALHSVELAALRTAELTGSAYERMAGVTAFRLDMPAPLRDGMPDAPLVAAVGDLASAAHAAARALHFAAEVTPPYRPDATTTLAVAVSRAAMVAVEAAAHRTDPAAQAMRLELAHAAAYAAHSAANALETNEQTRATAAVFRRAGHVPAAPSAAFPPSSRRLIRLLSQTIDAEAPGRDGGGARLGAARAARDAAEHAMRAHDRCRVDAAPTRVMCRVARLASRACAHAGFAALRQPV